MDNLSWILALISVVLVLIVLFSAFYMLYKSNKRLIMEKHRDDVVEENIAVLYSDYEKKKQKKSITFAEYIQKKKSGKKARGILLNIVFGILGILLIAVIAASIAFRFTGGQVYINNTAFYVVETDSMSEKNPAHEDELEGYDDQIPARTFILLEKLDDSEELVPYTIYAYKDNEGQVIIHRYIEPLDDGTFLFRGDSNASPIASDVGVTRNQIIGRFTGYQNHALGETIYFLKSPFGIVLLIALTGIVIAQSLYSDKLDKLYDQRYETLLPHAEEIHAKYQIIEDERRKRDILPGKIHNLPAKLQPRKAKSRTERLNQMYSFQVGGIYYVLYGGNGISTGEKVEIIKENEYTCVCKVLSQVNSYDSPDIEIAKDNLAKIENP